jgi:potassium-transporting ATPase potassium-binding subunit
MNWQGWAQIAVFAALVTVVVKSLGGYIVRNVDGEGPEQRVFAPLECGLYRLAGVDPAEEQGWVQYALALLWFHLAGIAMLYALLRLQNLLPLNPQQMDAMTPDLALNTAVSFATNTSWQSYGGETTLSYLSQMAGIVVQSFMSAAVGVAVALAPVRGFARRSEGNEVKNDDARVVMRARGHPMHCRGRRGAARRRGRTEQCRPARILRAALYLL